MSHSSPITVDYSVLFETYRHVSMTRPSGTSARWTFWATWYSTGDPSTGGETRETRHNSSIKCTNSRRNFKLHYFDDDSKIGMNPPLRMDEAPLRNFHQRVTVHAVRTANSFRNNTGRSRALGGGTENLTFCNQYWTKQKMRCMSQIPRDSGPKKGERLAQRNYLIHPCETSYFYILIII